MYYQRHKKRGICCCFSPRAGTRPTFSRCNLQFRFLPFFELATDSLKSRALSVMILITAFLGPLSILLQSLGFTPLSYSDRPRPAAPSDGTLSPFDLPPDFARAFYQLFQAIWVIYTAVVAIPLLSGNSSNQSIIVTVVTTIISAIIAGNNMYFIISETSPDSVREAFYMLFVSTEVDVWPYYIVTALQGVMYTAFSMILFIMFVIQCVRTIRFDFEEDYDQIRLRQYYDLVQRLLTPSGIMKRRAILHDSSFSLAPPNAEPQRRPLSLWRFMRRTFLFKADAPPLDQGVDAVLAPTPNTASERHPLLLSPPARRSVRTPRHRMRSSKSSNAIDSAPNTPSRISQRIGTTVWSHEDYTAASEDDIVDLNDAFKEEDVDLDSDDHDGTFLGKLRAGIWQLYWKAKGRFLRKMDSMRHNFISYMDKKPEPPPIQTYYEQDGDFHFPSRVLMTCATSMVVVVLVSFVIISKGYVSMKAGYADYPVGLKRSAEQGLFWSFIGSASVAFAVTVLSWSSMLKSYRNLVLSLRRGNAKVEKEKYSIFFSSAYIGYQIAHSVLGFVVILVIVMLLWNGVSSLVTSESARATAAAFLKTTFLTWFIRQILSWTVFPLLFTKWGSRYIRLPYIFQFVEFVLMFLDALSGIVSSISRLVVGATIVMLNIGRLDVPIYPSGYHHIDGAYVAFIATALLDHYTNNPIKLVFVDLLWKSVRPGDSSSSALMDPQLDAESVREERRKRARNKWRLIVLMLQNPSLVQYRKHNLRKKAAEEWKSAAASMAVSGK